MFDNNRRTNITVKDHISITESISVIMTMSAKETILIELLSTPQKPKLKKKVT